MISLYYFIVNYCSETYLHFWGPRNCKVSFSYNIRLQIIENVRIIIIFHSCTQMNKTSHQSFEGAAKAIRDSDKDKSLHKVTQEEKMKLYALYKQATEGDCTNTKPDENADKDERAKCKAWCGVKGKSKENAEKEYVDMARSLLNKYGASKLIDF